jgi:manganese transport protein
LLFGFFGVKPIPAIIAAQAFNGLILPFISIFLIFVINNPKLMGFDKLNKWFSNYLMGFVVWITLLIGTLNVIKSATKIFSFDIKDPDLLFTLVAIITFLISVIILVIIYKKRKLDFALYETEKNENI